MSTCNWLDLQTLGSQPVMPESLPITGQIKLLESISRLTWCPVSYTLSAMNVEQSSLGSITNRAWRLQESYWSLWRNEFREIYLKVIKEPYPWKMSTCSRLDLETLGSQTDFPPNSPWTLIECTFVEELNFLVARLREVSMTWNSMVVCVQVGIWYGVQRSADS
jgi:hypothetical protein